MSKTARKIKCLIVDDEPLAQEVLDKFIQRYPDLQLVEKCDSAMLAFEALHKDSIDLLFLDINMPIVSGLKFLKSLSNPPLVVFTTAYPDYAVEGFNLNAVDYLMKPISFERFEAAIEKVMERLQRVYIKPTVAAAPSEIIKDYIFVKANGKLVKINYSDLLYCEGMKDYIKLHLKSGKYLVIHQTMKGMEEQLPAQMFMRVHKSYISSLPAIKSFHDNMLHFIEGDNSIPVSNSYKEELLKKLSE